MEDLLCCSQVLWSQLQYQLTIPAQHSGNLLPCVPDVLYSNVPTSCKILSGPEIQSLLYDTATGLVTGIWLGPILRLLDICILSLISVRSSVSGTRSHVTSVSGTRSRVAIS